MIHLKKSQSPKGTKHAVGPKLPANPYFPAKLITPSNALALYRNTGSPAGLLGDSDLLADLHRRAAFGQQLLPYTQFTDDLFCRVSDSCQVRLARTDLGPKSPVAILNAPAAEKQRGRHP